MQIGHLLMLNEDVLGRELSFAQQTGHFLPIGQLRQFRFGRRKIQRNRRRHDARRRRRRLVPFVIRTAAAAGKCGQRGRLQFALKQSLFF